MFTILPFLTIFSWSIAIRDLISPRLYDASTPFIQFEMFAKYSPFMPFILPHTDWMHFESTLFMVIVPFFECISVAMQCIHTECAWGERWSVTMPFKWGRMTLNSEHTNNLKTQEEEELEDKCKVTYWYFGEMVCACV